MNAASGSDRTSDEGLAGFIPHAKLYVLTRQDLSSGQQATQSVHAAFLFAHTAPERMARWFEDSSYLVLLGVADEAELDAWAERLEAKGCSTVSWFEPDRGDELTAVAVAPSPAAERTLSSLPLLLKEPVMA